jgi:SAM-dependent methyltransferase
MMLRLIDCEVCGSSQHQFLFEERDRIFGTPGKFRVVQCKECGLIFVNPQPDAEALRAYYPEAYYEVKPSHYREYSRLRKRVLGAYFGYRRSPDPDNGFQLLEKVFLLPFKRRYQNSIPFVENGRLLDIGCGNGTELFKLKALGWKTYGVEIDEGASQVAGTKGIEVFNGDLMAAHYPDQFFHVVRMSFVLEHLLNPRETLREIERILHPRGRVYISIQNARSLHYWLFRNRWFSLDIPRHLFSFTPGTMGRLLAPLDMRIERIRYESGTRTFMASLQYWLNDRLHGGAALVNRQPLLESHLLRNLFRFPCWVIDRLRLGDLIDLEIVRA